MSSEGNSPGLSAGKLKQVQVRVRALSEPIGSARRWELICGGGGFYPGLIGVCFGLLLKE